MISEERREKLLQLLEKTGSVTVAELSQHMHVSRMTVHRDLEVLAAAGLLRKVHGGALPVVRNSPAPDVAMPFTERKIVHTEAKEAIARHLAKLVANAKTLALDASSTVFALAHHLQPAPGNAMFIVTDSIPLFQELQRRNLGVRLALTGGESHPKTGTLVGPLAIKSLEGQRFDFAVVSAAGLMAEKGEVYDATPEGAAFKQALISRAEKAILAVDKSKMNFLGPYQWAVLSDFDYLVTEEGPRPTKKGRRPK